jgi:hypothetical protein
MIFEVKPLEASELRKLYICSVMNMDDMMIEAENFDMKYMSSDDGVKSHEGDPFLLSMIYVN